MSSAIEDASDEEDYASLADEMNDPDVEPWNEEDWDPDAVTRAKRYAAKNRLNWPPGVGDYDRWYESQQMEKLVR